MTLYELTVESWGDIISEDLYINKENAIKAALEYISNKPYVVDKIEAEDVIIKEYSSGDVDFYSPLGSCISDVYICAVETAD